MVIARATALNDTFVDVYAELNTNISDPASRGKQWMFSDLPDFDTIQALGFPIIVIKTNDDEDRPTFDNTNADLFAEIIVEIYSLQNSQTRTLRDSIRARFNGTNFPQFNFDDYKPGKGNVVINNQEVHVRTAQYNVGLINVG